MRWHFCGDVYKTSAVSVDMHQLCFWSFGYGENWQFVFSMSHFIWFNSWLNQGERVTFSDYMVLCKFQKSAGVSRTPIICFATVDFRSCMAKLAITSWWRWHILQYLNCYSPQEMTYCCSKCSKQSLFHYLNYPINQTEENETFGSHFGTIFKHSKEWEWERAYSWGSKCPWIFRG